ncbi:MAG: hypothetical protein ACKON7_05080, partial [Planctomycetaceae bacterium]
MSLSDATTTVARATTSARGTGICHDSSAASRSMRRLPRTSTTASPASGCRNGIVTRPPALVTPATSTMPGGPTSSISKPGSTSSTSVVAGAPRASTRSRASSATRAAPTSKRYSGSTTTRLTRGRTRTGSDAGSAS